MSDINVTVTNPGAASVSVSGGSTVNATVGNGGTVKVSTGTISPGNATVVSGTLAINSTTTLAPGSNATVTNKGTAYAALLDIGIPAGVAGATGPAGPAGQNGTNGITPSFAIGNVVTGAAGSSASVTATPSNGGANVTLDLTIPRGDPGTNGSSGTSLTLSDATPSALGTAAAGTSSTVSRADHVHAAQVVSYANLTNVPSTFTPSTHTHTASAITDFTTAAAAAAPVQTVAGRSGDVTLGMSDVTGLVATLDQKLDASSVVDGGEYVGVIVTPTGITITQQPQPQSAQTTSTVTFDASLAVGSAASPAAFYYDGSTLWATSPTSGTTYYKRQGGSWSTFTNASGGYVKGYLAATSGALIAASYGDSGGRTTNGGTSWSTLTSSLRFSGLAASSSVAVGLVGPSSPTVYSQPFLTSPLVTSTDNGATWSAVSAAANGAVLRAITYANGRFMAVGTRLAASSFWNGTPYDSFPAAITSTDGLTWTESSISSTGVGPAYSSGGFVSPLSVAFGGGRWVIVGCGPQDGPSTDSGTGITSWYAATKVPQAGSTVAGTRDILTSTDGTTWTRAANALPSTAIWTSVTYAAGQWLAFTSSGNTYATSPDGLTWTARALPSSKTNLGIYGNAVYDGDSIYVGGSQRVQIAVSSSTVSATFSVAAYDAGGAVVAYQWEISTDAGLTWSNVSGATSTLSLTGLTSSDNGKRFRCVISATGATPVTSNSATLTVT